MTHLCVDDAFVEHDGEVIVGLHLFRVGDDGAIVCNDLFLVVRLVQQRLLTFTTTFYFFSLAV
jgi:hypothetical protein